MTVADKTYSFRAPTELADRIRAARVALPEIFSSVPRGDHFTHELEIAVLRRLRRLPETRSQMEFVRAITEAFVSTVERVQREERMIEEMRTFDREDVEGASWREGALLLVAERIEAEGD
ncbi:MAG: hypothetical protein ACYCSI_02640 [Solirubrobacteraceae bacterium]